jgi:ABC-type polysaccharide/polyol phosphate export permease
MAGTGFTLLARKDTSQFQPFLFSPMDHLITREFQFSRDFKSISWLETLWYNCLRAACTGLVFAILALCGGDRSGALLSAPLLWPVMYLVFALPVGLFCAFLAKFIPIVGIITFAMSLFWVLIGDPIVWILKQIAPKAVPVESVSFVNFALIMWVLKAEGVTEVIHTEQRPQHNQERINKL